MTPVAYVPAELQRWLPGATVRAVVSGQSYAILNGPEGEGSPMSAEMNVNDQLIGDAVNFPFGRAPRLRFHRDRFGMLMQAGEPDGTMTGFSPRVPIFPAAGSSDIPEFLRVSQRGAIAARWDIDVARPEDDTPVSLLAGFGIVLSDARDFDAIGQGAAPFAPANRGVPNAYLGATPGDIGGGAGFGVSGFVNGTEYRFVSVRDRDGGLNTLDAIAWPVPFDEWARVSFRILAANATTGAPERFRCLVNGVEVFARDANDPLYPQIEDDSVGWRFVAQGDFVPLMASYLLDNYVCWWGDNRIFFGT